MTVAKDFKATIVIPAFNESSSIEATISELKQLEANFEIIVVDDGSTDDTGIIARGAGVNVITNPVNKGYGASLKTGIRHASSDIIVITDADGTYPNNMIPHLIDEFISGDFDMVVGSRTGKKVHIPLIRKPAKWFLGKLANYLSGSKIPDLNSGLRVMRKETINRFDRILCEGFSFTSTITLCMLTNDLRVKFIPIDYFKRSGRSKIKPIRDTLNFLQLIIRTAMYFDPLKVFIPISILLFILAFTILLGSHYFLGRIMDVSFGIVIMSSIIVLAIGMLADLIDKRLK